MLGFYQEIGPGRSAACKHTPIFYHPQRRVKPLFIDLAQTFTNPSAYFRAHLNGLYPKKTQTLKQSYRTVQLEDK